MTMEITQWLILKFESRVVIPFMLKKEREMVLDKELLDENRIEREEIEKGVIVKDSNKEDIDINI